MSDERRIVELEPGVWLAAWRGDPGRTLVLESARVLVDDTAACAALASARSWRPFLKAKITHVDGTDVAGAPTPTDPHVEAAARFPHAREFLAGDLGEAFADAKRHSMNLGLSHVDKGTDPSGTMGRGCDGVIVPGTPGHPPKGPPVAKWLGAVTLYWRDREVSHGGA